MMRSFAPLALVLAPLAAAAQPAEPLAPYFGFEDSRVVVADDGAGPLVAADFNADGRPDLALVNNRKSRIELFYLRAEARSDEELRREYKVNELPPNPWYDHEKVSVAHRVTALRAHDVDADGRLDLVYAGADPMELVVLRQESPSRFTLMSRTRVRDLATRQDGLAIADVVDDARPEVLAIADGRIRVFPLDDRGRFGEPRALGSGGLQQIHVEDYNGDGLADVLGVVPEDSAPLRLWLQTRDPRSAEPRGLLTAEMRFEMPALVTAEPLRFSGRDAASIGVLERASRRMVFYDLTTQPVLAGEPEPGVLVEREVQAEVTAFGDGAARGRSVVLIDLDADGLTDLLTTDQKANSLVVHRQQPGIGLARAELFSAFKAPKAIDAGRWFDGPRPQVFVLSEEEKTVGVSIVGEGDRLVEFPRPIPFATAGATPIAMKLVPGEPPALAVVMKDGRKYTLEVHRRTAPASAGDAMRWSADIQTIALGELRRDPAAILPFDADRDGTTDLLLLTPGEPMIMVRGGTDERGLKPAAVLTKDDMPQFGLVQAAGPENTVVANIDDADDPELLIADANFVRAAAYDADKGWRVVDQVNTMDGTAQLAGLTLLTDAGADGAEARTRIVAADKANGRLLILDRNEAGRYALAERVRLMGFQVGPIRAGAFAGDGEPGILALADDAFALVRLGGVRPGLEQFAAFRSDSEDRREHAMEAGDVNGDGYLDLVVLDAMEQMCQILTFSATRKVHHAMEFKVFESRLFGRGDTREYQPSAALIADLTGDGADDVALLAHDRVLIYPQATAQ